MLGIPKQQSSHHEVLCTKSIFKKFRKINGKIHVKESLFKRLQALKCFPVSFATFFRTGFLQITSRRSRPDMFCKKAVFKHFVKFTGKSFCQSLLLNKA